MAGVAAVVEVTTDDGGGVVNDWKLNTRMLLSKSRAVGRPTRPKENN